MDRNNFVKMFWKVDVETFISHWEIGLSIIDKKDLDGYRPSSLNNKLARECSTDEFELMMYQLIENPIEQLIATGLFLSMYGSFEKCLSELIDPIECKSGENFEKYSKKNKGSTLEKIKNFYEVYSDLKFNDELFEKIKALSKIRNAIIHHGAKFEGKYLKGYKENQSIINEFAIVHEFEWDEVDIGEDLIHVKKAFESFKELLMDILKQEIFTQ